MVFVSAIGELFLMIIQALTSFPLFVEFVVVLIVLVAIKLSLSVIYRK